MKKLLVILVCFLFVSCSGQDHIELKRNSGGLFEIECTLNGKVTVPFYADTGASETVISRDVFMTLVKTGTVVREDMLPSRTYTLADGSQVTSFRFILHEIKIGNRVFRNIPISIAENINAPLLLGQSTLERFGMVMIDYENNLLIYE